MGRGTCWEADSLSINEEIPNILWKPLPIHMIDPCPEPGESSPYYPILFLKDSF
jgi:hypothetical protein